jgi:hypothetical protein
MAIAVGVLFLFFKKKQWILTKQDTDDILFTSRELGKDKNKNTSDLK